MNQPDRETEAAMTEAGLAAQIRSAQTHMLYSQLPVSVTGTMTGATLLTASMWAVAPPWLLLGWLALMSCNQGWRHWLGRRYRRLGLAPEQIERAATMWAAGSAISGCLWGLAYILFFPADAPVFQAVLTVLIFGVAAGATPLISSHAPSFYVFIFPALLPLVARNAVQGDMPHVVLALICLAVTLGILSFGRNFHRLLVSSLRTRFENEALAARLAAQNADLERAKAVAEQASRAKTQFFAAASHDLRQPLHAMGLFAAALVEKVRDPEVMNVVNSIYASVEALEALFNELLDISKIDAGAIRPSVADFPLDALLARLHMDLEPEAFEKGLRLRVHAPKVFVRSDPLLLERVLRNLIGNAIRYTERGGILVGVRRRAGLLRIEVWDTGIGIPEDQQEQVFEEFYQIGNPERDRRKGLGLGLSIVRRLCDLLGHPLGLRSRPRRGSVFRIEIPAGQKPAQAERPAAATLPATDFAGRLILVVDDEAVVRESMAALLAGWGAQVVGCAGVAEAATAAAGLARAPDLIVADHRLREGTVGGEAIRLVRAHFGKHIPGIMVTGSTTPERIEDAKTLDCHLLLKPVMPAKLRTLISFKLREGR